MTDANAKVFVGRLPDGCTEKDLETLFSTYGTVKQIDLIGKYGFVHMAKREEAEEAIKKLSNYQFMGSQLTVQFSTSKMNGGSGKMRGGFNRGRGGPRRSFGPYQRNNAYPPNRPPMNRFGGPPVAPNNFGPPFYDDMNGYFREPFYPEPEPYYPNARRSGPPYEQPFNRRAPPAAPDFPRVPAPPVQTDFYGRGDGQYSKPLAYEQFQPVPPPVEAVPPPQASALGYGGAPARNGFGATAYANRGPIAPVPPPPAAQAGARWQPY